MNSENETTQAQKNRGLSANAFLLPVLAALGVLHLVIIVLSIRISSSTMDLSNLMRTSSYYIEDATSLIGGASLLADTANNFVLSPLADDGTLNVFPLYAYARELGTERRGRDVAARFHDYNVSRDTFALLYAAAGSADYLYKTQLRAFALVASVYPLPDEPALQAIVLPELTEKEQQLTNEERLEAARALLLNSEYSLHKQSLSLNVTSCVESLRASASETIGATSRKIDVMRTLMWLVAGAVIVLLIFTFVVLYHRLIMPLTADAHLIETDEPLDDSKGLREVRLLAGAYNRLLQRRERLETILRSAAVTDTLTGLPNRYGFEQYLLEAVPGDCALTVLLFDVNYLKQTNDTQGHAAGDRLLRSSADCIRECFGAKGESNCFRFGGDEFAAVLKCQDPGTLEKLTERFLAAQAKWNVSISWGVASTDKFGATTIKDLMNEADRDLYIRKEQMHSELDAAAQAALPLASLF